MDDDMAAVQFGILGPLVLERDGEQVPVGRPKQRALLALLVTEAGRTVSVDRMIDELWGDEPPAKATASLQAYVSNLRRLLEPGRAGGAASTLLVTEAPGYRLAVDPAQVDAARFETLAATAGDLVRAGSPADALAAANAALALWRGPPLVEFRDDGFAQATVVRLEELHLTCEEDRTAAMLDLGLSSTAVAELEAATRRQPLRERRWALLMTALYRAGRSADALDRYQHLRRVLLDQLGLEPSPELQALEHAILAHDETLRTPASPARAAGLRPAAATAPSRAPERASRPLLERANELLVADAAVADAVDGRTRVLVIEGEAGMGKTALAEEIAVRARAAGMDVAWGACHEDADAPALWPWAQVLRGLGAAVPAVGGDGTDAFAMVDAFTSAIAERASARPVAGIVEDVHWADPATLRMLAFVAVELRDIPLLLVVTRRADERAETVGPAVTALLRHGGSVHLPVQPLSAAATDALAAAVAADRPVHTAGLHSRTGGNPLFVTELARLLAAEGPDAGLPLGVREVIARRLRRLPEEANAVLSLAAVAGAEIDLGTLADASGVAIDRVADLLDAGVAIGLLRSGSAPGRLAFAHALVRETVLDSLSDLHRRRLHARLAAMLAERARAGGPVLYEWAHHAVEGVPFVALADARAAAEAAGASADADLAFDTAAQWWRAALEVHDASAEFAADTSARGRLLLALARSLSREGADQTAQASVVDALDLAERRGDVSLAVEAAATLGETGGAWLWVKPGSDPTALLARFERALDGLRDDDDAGRATVLATVAVGNSYLVDPDRADALSADALDAARRVGNPVIVGRALAARWRSIWRPGFAPEMLAVGSELDELALAAPHAGFDLEAATCLHIAHLALADVPVAIAHLDRAIDLARQRRLIQFEVQLLPNRATYYLLCGELEQAGRVGDELLAKLDRIQSPFAGAQRAALLWRFGEQTGDLEAAADAVDAYLAPLFPFYTAVAAHCRGAHDDALRLIAGEHLGDVRPTFDGTGHAALEAELAADVGAIEVAARAAATLGPYEAEVGALGTSSIYGPIALGLGRALAVAGHADAAVRALRLAVDVADRNGLRTSAIWARIRLAEVVADRDVAIALAGAAAEEASRLGLDRPAAMAAELQGRRTLDG